MKIKVYVAVDVSTNDVLRAYQDADKAYAFASDEEKMGRCDVSVYPIWCYLEDEE